MKIDEILSQLQAAQGDPEKLTLATLELVLATHPATLRDAFEAASIPHWFDAEILGKLLQIDQAGAEEALEQLRTLPMIESFAARNGWNVHEATRLALRKQLHDDTPQRFHLLLSRAAECFEGNDPVSRIETIYHRLLAVPEDAASELEQLWKAWDDAGRYESLQALALALHELIRSNHLTGLARARALVCLGWIRRGQLTLRNAEEFAREALDIFRRLSNEPGEADVHSQLGDILETAGNLPESLVEFGLNRQIRVRLVNQEPENAERQRDLSASHSNVGDVLQLQGQLTSALAEYQAGKRIMQQLTERDRENEYLQRDLSAAHSNVGQVLQLQGQLAAALAEYESNSRIMTQLTEHDPENYDWQQDLSRVWQWHHWPYQFSISYSGVEATSRVVFPHGKACSCFSQLSFSVFLLSHHKVALSSTHLRFSAR